ncbi:hypothetical protein AAG570_002813 [Ranatra chinensis]|uniref:Uncharacterized protein n=1 Tax=Ranatra chinensis TaxID=642074 RepID=A0ABD0YJA8_9HEMI
MLVMDQCEGADNNNVAGCKDPGGTGASWHPHVYASPPKAPTPHSISDILGWNRREAGREETAEEQPLDLVVRAPQGQPLRPRPLRSPWTRPPAPSTPPELKVPTPPTPVDAKSNKKTLAKEYPREPEPASQLESIKSVYLRQLILEIILLVDRRPLLSRFQYRLGIEKRVSNKVFSQ